MAITSYLRRLGKSIAMASVETLKDQMPVTAKLFEDNKEEAVKTFKDVTDFRAHSIQLKNITDTFITKPVNLAINNLKKDLKTGDFYNDNGTVDEDTLNALAASLAQEAGYDISDITQLVNTKEEQEQPSSGGPEKPDIDDFARGSLITSSLIGSELQKNTKSIANVLVRTTSASMKTMQDIARMQYLQNERQMEITKAGFGSLAHGFNSIIEFNNKAQAVHIQNSIKFYDNVSNNLNTITAIMKEQIEIQRALYKKQDKEVDNGLHSDYNKAFQNGGFNLAGYKSLLEGRAKNSGAYQLYTIAQNMLPLLTLQLQHPMQFVTKEVIKGLIGTDAKVAMSRFDNSLNGIIQTALAKAADSDSPIARFFGIKQKNLKLENMNAMYDKGPQPWNGIAQKALVEVIPAFLARIEAGVTGHEERIYDYQTGKFTTLSKAVKYDKQQDILGTNEAMKEMRKELYEIFAPLKMANMKQRKQLHQDIKTFTEGIYRRGYVDVEDIARAIRIGDKKYGGDPNVVRLLLEVTRNMDGAVKANATARINKAKADKMALANFTDFTKQNPMSAVFNNSKSGAFLNATNKNVGVYSVLKDLPEIRDSRKMSLFDYQYKIYKTLFGISAMMQRMVENGFPTNGGGSHGGRGGGPSGPRPKPADGGKFNIYDGFDEDLKTFKQNDRKIVQEREDNKKLARVGLRGLYDNPNLTDEEIRKKARLMGISENKLRRDLFRLQFSRSYHDSRLNNMSTLGYGNTGLGVLNGISSPEDQDYGMDLTKLGNNQIHTNAIYQAILGSNGTLKKLKQAHMERDRAANSSFLDDIFHIDTKNLPKGVDPNAGFFDKLIQASSVGDKLSIISNGLGSIGQAPSRILARTLTVADTAIYEMLFGKETVTDSKGNKIRGVFGRMIYEIDKAAGGLNEHLNDFFEEGKVKFGNVVNTLQKSITNAGKKFIEEQTGYKFDDVKSLANGLLSHFGLDVDSMAEDAVGNVRQLFGMSKYSKRTQDKRNDRAFRQRMMEIYGDENKIEELLKEFRADTAGLNMNDKQTAEYLNKADNRRVSKKDDDLNDEQEAAYNAQAYGGDSDIEVNLHQYNNKQDKYANNQSTRDRYNRNKHKVTFVNSEPTTSGDSGDGDDYGSALESWIKNNIEGHAKGARNVTKGGLAFISEGEAIIPASMNPFNPRRETANDQMNAVNEDRNRINLINRIKSIPGHANGTVDAKGPLSPAQARTKIRKLLAKSTQDTIDETVTNIKDIIMRSYSKGIIDPRNILRDMANGSTTSQRNILNMVDEAFDQVKSAPGRLVDNVVEGGTAELGKAGANAIFGEAKPNEGKIKGSLRRVTEGGISRAVRSVGDYAADKVKAGLDVTKMDMQAAGQLRDATDLIPLGEELLKLMTSSNKVGKKSKFAAIQNVMDEISQIGTDTDDSNLNEKLNKIIPHVAEICKQLNLGVSDPPSLSSYAPGWLNRAREVKSVISKVKWLHSVVKAISKKKDEEIGKLLNPRNSYQKRAFWDKKTAAGKEVAKTTLAQDSGLSDINQFIASIFGKDVTAGVNELGKTIKQNLGDIAGGGAIGAALSFALPLGGPLLGAVAGASISLIKNNEALNRKVFGDEKNAGMLPPKFVKFMEKYLPDAKKFGAAGGVAGLLTGFGPLTGAVVGASMTILKNNDTINQALFGKKDKNGKNIDSSSGILSKDRRTAIKKALPKAALMFLPAFFIGGGSLGILGSAAVASGLSMLSSTEAFKSAILGRKDRHGKRRGGLAGAIRQQIINPYRWLFNDFKKASKKWLRDEMFGPLSRGIRPLGRGLFGVFKSVGSFVNKKLKASPFGNKYEKAVNAVTGIPKHLTGAIRAAGRGAGAVLSFVPKRIEAAGNALVAREAGKYKGLEYSGRGAGDMLEILRNHGKENTDQYRFYQSISTGKKNDEQLRTLAKDFRKFSALGSEDERNAQLKSVLDDAKSRMQGVLEDYNNGLENGEMAMDTNILNGEISIRGKNGKRGYVRGIKGLIDRVARGKMTSDEAIEALDGFNIPTADVKEKFINIIKEAATNTELINNRSKAEATFKEKKNATPLFDALKAAGILSENAKMEDGDKEWDAAYEEFTKDPSKLAKMSREIDRELQHRASLNKRAEEGDKSAKLDEELQTSTMDYQARALEQGDAELDVLNKILDYVSGKIKNRAEYKALRAPDLVNQAIKRGGFFSVSSDYFKDSLSGRRENEILDEIDRNMDEAGKNIHKANVAHANIKQRDLRAAAKNNFTSKNGIKIDKKDQALFGNRNITRNKYKFGALQNFADMKGKSGGSVNASAMLKMKLSDESIDAIIYLASVGYPIDAEEMGQIEDATSEGINLLYTLGDLGVDLSDLGRLGSVDKDIAKRVSDLAAAPIIVEKDEKGEVTKVNARGYNILNLGQMIDMVTNEEMMQRTGGDFYHIADKMDQHTIGLLFGNARTSNTSRSISKSNKYKRNMSEDFAQRREDRLKEIATKNDDVSTKSPDYAKYGKEEAQTSMNAIAKALSLNDEVASSASKDLNKLLKLVPAGKDSEAVLNLIAKHVKSDPVMMDQLADLAGTNLVNKSIDEDAVNNLVGKLVNKVKGASGHAFGIGSFMSKITSPVSKLGSMFSSTNTSNQQKQESKSEESETKPTTPAENAAKANVTSKDVAASSAAISAAVSANSARSASANAPIKPEGKKGKKDTTYVADADGDSKEMTTNAYGELVEVHNKHNEEIKKKNKFKLKLQERSTAALEAIAAKIGAANIKGTAKKVAGSLGDLFKDIFSPFGQLKDFLCGLPLVGPIFALVFSKMFKGVKKLGKGIFNLGKTAIKWAGNKLLQKTLSTKFGQAIAKVPGMIAEKVSNGLFSMLKNIIPHKGIIGGAAGLLGLLFGNHMQNTNEDGSIAHGAGGLIKSIGAGTLGYSVAGKLFDHTLGKRLTGTKGAIARSLFGSLASGAASDYADDGQMSFGNTLAGMVTSLALDGGLAAGLKLIGKTKLGRKLANSRFGKLLGMDAPEEENSDTPVEGEEGGATGQANIILSKIEENTRKILDAITNKNSDDDDSSSDDDSTLQDLAEDAKDKLTNKEDSEESKEGKKNKSTKEDSEKEGSKGKDKDKDKTTDKPTKETSGKDGKKGRFGKIKGIAGSIGRRAKGFGRSIGRRAKGFGKGALKVAATLGGTNLASDLVNAASGYADDDQMSLGSTLIGMGTSLVLDGGGLTANRNLIGNTRFGKLLGMDAPEEEENTDTDTPAEGEEESTAGHTNDILSKIEENTRNILDAITNKNSDTSDSDDSDDSSSDDDDNISTLQDLAEDIKDRLANREDSEEEGSKDKDKNKTTDEPAKETEKGGKKGRFGKIRSIAGSIGRRVKGFGKGAFKIAATLGGTNLASDLISVVGGEDSFASRAMSLVSDASDIASTAQDAVSAIKNSTDLNDAKNEVQNIKDAALNTTEAADEGVKGSLVAKLKEGITGVINKISSIVPGKGSADKIKAFGARLLEKCSTPEYLARAARKMTRQASAAVTSSTGIGAILGIGITLYGAISDFQHGYSSADSILGVPDGSTSMGMKIMCGVITALWSAVPVLGFLIDSDEITKFAIQELGPMFGFTQRDIDDLKKGKKDQDKNNTMDSSAHDQKANKITDAIKNSWESIKNNPAAAFTAGPLGLAVYGANQFANLVKNGAHAVGNATSSLWKSAKEAGKNAMAWFNQSADSVRQTASGALDWLANKGNSFKDSIIGGAASLGTKAWNGLKSIGSTIADAGKSGWNTVTSAASSLASKFGFGSGKHSMYGTGGFYSQLDPAYAMPYNTASDTEPQSMRDSGCGPVAASNALSSLGIDVDPRISAEYALKGNYKERNGGTFPSFFEHMFKDAGVDASYLHTHQDIKDSLAKGDPVVLMGKDPNGESNNSPFAENPHYVTATGLDENGNIIVQDPETNTPNKTYDPSMLDKTSYAISARSKHFGSGKMANTLKSKLGRGVDKVSSKIGSIYNSIRNSRFGRSKYGRGDDLKAKMWALADWVAQQLHTDKKFVYAQWYNESGGFDSPCAKNNFAGISSPDGGWMNFDTPEEFASYFANIVAKGWPKCCNTSTIDDYGKGLQYPDDKQPYCTDPPGDGYINAIKENMKSCPSGEPNKSLIDTSKLYFKGKVSGSPNNNSNGSNTKQKSKSFMSAFANVASILSSAVSGGADDSKSSGNNTNSGGSNAINGDKKQNAKQIWDFLKGKGLTNVQIAAIMGNIEAESEYNPAAVNDQSGAKGICQWLGDRADKLDALAAQQNKSWSDLSVQLDYLWQEISNNKSDYPLPTSDNVDQAVIEWEKSFERSEDTNSYTRRRESANAALNEFGKGKFKNGTKYGKGIRNFISSKFNKRPRFGQSKRRLAKFGMGDDINWNVIESNHPGDDVSTNFSNLQPYVKSALNDFASKYYQAHNQKLLVTGGAETVDVNGNPVHADGQWSHHTGWKTDITTDLTNEDIAILRAMGASVNLEGDHYDIDWSGHDSRDLNPVGQQKTANGAAYSGGSNGGNQQAAAPAKDYTGGFFDKLAGVASKMAGPVKQLMAAFNKGVMGAAGSVFGNSLKFIFGDDNPFAGILGFGDDSNGGSGGGGSNGNGTFVPSSNPKINEAMKYADEVVANKKNYGDNGCVRWVNDFLQHANIPDTGGESVPNVIQISKGGNYYKWKDPSEGALPGDICVFGPDPDGNHVGIADGAGGMWDVSSQAGHVVLHRSINDTFPNALLGYVATGGDGKGNVAAPSTQTKSEEEMRKDMGSSNAAKGKHSKFGTGKYGRGGFRKFFKKVKNFGKKVWTGIKKFGKNILNSNTKFNNTRKKTAEDSLYTQIKAPNGLMYTENDIKYLMSANKDLTREQAIQLLSKADKYTKDLTAPNGKKYTQNDIEYLMKNGYDFGAAIDLLSGSRKYDGMSDKEAKKSFMKSYNKDVKDNNNFNTTFTTNNLPDQYQYHYKGATYSKGLNLASDIAAKGKHSQYGMGGFSRFFKKAKKFGSKVWSGIKNFFKGFRNSVANTKNPANDLYTDKVAPNGLKYSKNDIKYLLDSNKGMKEEEAIKILSQSEKYTTDITAPNGTKYSQNDIEYLMKNGYTFKDAIDLLSQQKKYTEITEEQKETSARDNSKKVFLKNYNSDLLGSTTSLNNPLPTEYQYHKEGFRSNGIDGLSAKGKHRYGMGDEEVVSIPYGENTDYQASYAMDPTVTPKSKSTTTPIKHFGANNSGSSLEDKLDKLIQLQAQNNNIINAILKVAMEYIKANAGAGSRQVMDPNTKNTMSVSNSNAAIISSLLSAINGVSTTMNGDFGSIGSTDFNDATLIGKTMDAISTR